MERVHLGYKNARLCLNEDIENDLAPYIKKAASIFYGITIHELQVIAYKLAIANKFQDIPHSWNVNEKACIDWTRGFLDRHKEISLQAPESGSF